MSLLDGKFDWITVLQHRAGEYRNGDAAGAGFNAPRSSVIKLCRISNACIEFVVACDKLADEPSSENRVHVETLKKRLIDVLQH